MRPTHRRRRGSGLIGILGELLLTLGVLLLLFLVWQLWWTDVLADREQAGIIDGLEQEWGEVDAERIAPARTGLRRCPTPRTTPWSGARCTCPPSTVRSSPSPKA
ncbi:hypothetical protein [Brachybacterium sp. Z12]|uniref:hypothetical protein n=1 Tax=Brachybacterium sp. Z12 TaxID=2759167 RepID=UPI00223A9525|nr:hypothetical protein [Brachybacterium sp. Z12]